MRRFALNLSFMPKVSVVIPCYNAENFAEACLETLLAQSLHDLEFIFVDDGSTDATAAILDSFVERDPRVRIIHQENKCQGGARNTGIEAATGEYIGFLDVDDLLSPAYYELLYAAAKRHDADIAWGNLKLFPKNKPPKYAVHFSEERVMESRADIVKGKSYHAVTKIYRRQLFHNKKLLFPEKRFYEDIFFSLPILFAANKVVTVPGADYLYAYVTSSVTRRKQTPLLQRQRYEAQRFLRDFIEKHGIPVPHHLRNIRKKDYRIGKASILKIRDYGRYSLALLFDALPVYYMPHKK